MRAVIQRVSHSSVTIDNKLEGEIDKGLCVLIGVGKGDNEEDLEYLASKIVNLRIFEDENGKMNRSLLDVQGGMLIISQFTLFGDCKRGRRPGFFDAAPPDEAIPLYNSFIKKIEELGVKKVQSGKFGADMKVEIINDGPVTIVMDTKEMRG